MPEVARHCPVHCWGMRDACHTTSLPCCHAFVDAGAWAADLRLGWYIYRILQALRMSQALVTTSCKGALHLVRHARLQGCLHLPLAAAVPPQCISGSTSACKGMAVNGMLAVRSSHPGIEACQLLVSA